MLSAAIAYQVLQQENPQTNDKVKALLEKHPWYANQWQARLQDVPVAERDQVLFMQAARWADDIRIKDKAQNRPSWHYINLPFKPDGQPANVQIKDLRYGGNDEQHREDLSVAKLLRLSLATLTFLIFFYSTTLLTSYFYPLDWAPIAF